ncbi:MAG: hypothetical protein LH461_00530 [Spirochaetaceae bacterium]|nr:hypothetical protein [Spirochaetaceae bacterium]
MPDSPPAAHPDVRRIEPAERGSALASVVAAFAVDPLPRWIWAEDERYAGCAPAFFGLLLDLRRLGGEVWAGPRCWLLHREPRGDGPTGG